MTIPMPVVIAIFLIAAIVGAVHGASWCSVLGVASPAVMGTMLMFQERHSRRKGNA